MPLQATSGAASYDAFGGGVAAVPNYIEEVFSTWLYTGNGSTQTINNGIDLAGKGGLVWFKSRSTTNSHRIFDTARGIHKFLNSSDTGAQTTNTSTLTAFNSTGFDIGSSSVINTSGELMASWTFREQPKFFDVVTYTGNGAGSRLISHNLGSAPGCIIVKCTSTTSNWMVWHRSISGQNNLYLNATDGTSTVASDPISVPGWPSSTSTTQFDVSAAGTDSCNDNGATYVAYLFAHNAGGFGLSGTDNVISCGSITGTGAIQDINLGYEPQWVLLKRTDSTGDWTLIDNMRGFTADGVSTRLFPNSSTADSSSTQIAPTATGFRYVATNGINTSGATGIYIAIRRGPMRTPTSGTSVFSPLTRTGTGSAATVTGVGFPPDLVIDQIRGSAGNATTVADRLRGRANYLATTDTNAEQTSSSSTQDITSFNMDGISLGTSWNSAINGSGNTTINWFFQRAPGFMDVCCYTGTGVARTVAHNLTVVPELMIVKTRSATGHWGVYQKDVGAANALLLSATNAAFASNGYWNSTAPTASVFTVGTETDVNQNAQTQVAYLFASCPGVSKVFNYTGNGSSQTINCGFTGGARFVMIKRTDSTGDWYVWDSARGIVSGNDPRLSLNSTAAEVTTDDSVDTDSTGFVVNQLSATNINVSSATYIGIAIA